MRIFQKEDLLVYLSMRIVFYFRKALDILDLRQIQDHAGRYLLKEAIF
jgi:hypothetical protein